MDPPCYIFLCLYPLDIPKYVKIYNIFTGETALHNSIYRGGPLNAQLLIDLGLNVNDKNIKGKL